MNKSAWPNIERKNKNKTVTAVYFSVAIYTYSVIDVGQMS